MAGIFDPAIFDPAIFDVSSTVVVRVDASAVWLPLDGRRLAVAIDDERRVAEPMTGQRVATPIGGPPWQA